MARLKWMELQMRYVQRILAKADLFGVLIMVKKRHQIQLKRMRFMSQLWNEIDKQLWPKR